MAAIKLDMMIDTQSESNLRDHWARKALRTKNQRKDAFFTLYESVGKSTFNIFDNELKITVKLTRMAPCLLDDDNLRGSLKAVRDGIADWLKIDDGDSRITWEYDQQKISKIRFVRTEILWD